ncbi:MAG: hypothetical protein AB7G93_16960 [Bdellovibrionales bacterium]
MKNNRLMHIARRKGIILSKLKMIAYMIAFASVLPFFHNCGEFKSGRQDRSLGFIPDDPNEPVGGDSQNPLQSPPKVSAPTTAPALAQTLTMTRTPTSISTSTSTSTLQVDQKRLLIWRDYNNGDVGYWSVSSTSGIETSRTVLKGLDLSYRVVALSTFKSGGPLTLLMWDTTDPAGTFIYRTMQPNGALGSPTTFKLTGITLAGPDDRMEVVACGDVNGDQKTDLILRDQKNGQVSALLLNGLGNPAIRKVTIGTPVDMRARLAAVTDQGSGKLNLFFHDRLNHSVSQQIVTNGLITGQAALPGSAHFESYWLTGAIFDNGNSHLVWRTLGDGTVGLWKMSGTLGSNLNIASTLDLSTGLGFKWKTEIGERDYQFINPQSQRTGLPAPKGRQYEVTNIPDTLDLSVRASYAIHNMTSMIDPTHDHELLWTADLFNEETIPMYYSGGYRRNQQRSPTGHIFKNSIQFICKVATDIALDAARGIGQLPNPYSHLLGAIVDSIKAL